MIEELQPEITIFPSYLFIPIHYTGLAYEGTEKVYAKQMFGSTRSVYQDDEKKENKKKYRTLSEFLKYRIDVLKTRKERHRRRAEWAEQRTSLEKYKKEVDQLEWSRLQQVFEKSYFSE